jgi:hypothetical protein
MCTLTKHYVHKLMLTEFIRISEDKKKRETKKYCLCSKLNVHNVARRKTICVHVGDKQVITKLIL